MKKIIFIFLTILTSQIFVSAAETVKFAFLAPDALTPANSAIHNGIKDSFEEAKTRFSQTLQLEYFSASNSEDEQIRQLNALYIDSYKGAVIYPVSEKSDKLSKKIEELSAKGLVVVVVGRDMPDSKRIACVGTDSNKFAAAVASEIKRLSGKKKVSHVFYFRTTDDSETLSLSDSSKIEKLLYPDISPSEFEKIFKPLSPIKMESIEYYSVYAAKNSVEIMRRDDYAEIFFSPYLLYDMVPIKFDGDRRFAMCIGAIPQLEQYIRNKQIDSCIFSDFYGWGFFSSRALIDKVMDKTNPSHEVRLLSPLVVTQRNISFFVEDWKKWTK